MPPTPVVLGPRAEFIEKNTFSFHNRHSGIWPDIAKS